MVFAMIGRFAGSALLKTVKDYVLLILVALGADRALRGGDPTKDMTPTPTLGTLNLPGLCRAADQRPDPGLRGAADRLVQLDHVPDDLHPDPATLLGPDLGDLGPAVHGHRGRRLPAADFRQDRGT
jgi:hypothetical protein